MAGDQYVSGSRTIEATPEAIFDVLTNPAMHKVIDGSGTVSGEGFGPERLSLGAKFGMKMKYHGVPYRVTSTVKEFDENRLIAWAHFGKHRWRYELEPTETDSTVVTETFDWSTSVFPKGIELAGYPKQHPANIEATLERLANHVET